MNWLSIALVRRQLLHARSEIWNFSSHVETIFHCFQEGPPFLLCWIAINHTLVEKSYNQVQNSYNKLELICVFHVKSFMPNPILHPTDNMLDICMQFQYVKGGGGGTVLDLVQGIFQKGSTFLWGHKEIINKLQILNHCSKDFQSRIVAFRLNKTVVLHLKKRQWIPLSLCFAFPQCEWGGVLMAIYPS